MTNAKDLAARLWRDGTELSRQERKEYADLIEQQAAEIEMLRADAERWRYLRTHCTYFDYEEHIGQLTAPPTRRWYHDTHFTQHNSLDAAIDAAMKGTT